MRRVRNMKQVILSPPDSPEATAVPNGLDVQTPVEGQGGDSPRGSTQMRDLPILLEEGLVEASSSGKGHDAPFLIGPKGHEEALLGRSQPDQARIGASSSGNEGQGQTSSSRNEDLSRVVAFMRGPEGPGEAFVSWVLSTRREGKAGASSSGNEGQGGTSSSRNENLSHEAAEAILSWFRSWTENEAGASSSGKEECQNGAVPSAEEGQSGASPRGSSPMRKVPTMIEEGGVGASLSTEEGLGGASLSGKEGYGGASQDGKEGHMTLRPSSRLQTAQSRARQRQGGSSLRARSHMTLRWNRLPEDGRGGASSSGKEGLGGAVRVGNEDRGRAALSGSDHVRSAGRLLRERPDGTTSSGKEGQRRAPPRRTEGEGGASIIGKEGEGGSHRSGNQVQSGALSIWKEDHVPAALFSTGEERQFGAPSKVLEEVQGQDGASTSGKGGQGGPSSSEKEEQGGASLNGKQGQVGASMSIKQVQGHEINRYVPQVPEGAERLASSPPELNINNRVVSVSKNGLGGKEGQIGASSSGPKGGQHGASWTGEPSQLFTSGKEVQGQEKIISTPPENANQNAVSSSPRFQNANCRAQASTKTHIKKINYDMGTWSLENGQVMGYFNVTRSDDKKVPMDNQFLREKYPQMLIDFYEQILQKNDPRVSKTSAK